MQSESLENMHIYQQNTDTNAYKVIFVYLMLNDIIQI